MTEVGAPESLDTEQLFRRHAAFVQRFLARLGVPRDAVEDAVQEVFLTAHRAGGYREGPAKPTTYLATIAVHAASAYRRSQRHAGRRRSESELDTLATHEQDPAQKLEVHDSLRQLQSALDRLDDNLRATLVLADGIGQSCPLIAQTMQVPLGTVYWRLDRARKKFRAAWKVMPNDRRSRLGLALSCAAPSATCE